MNDLNININTIIIIIALTVAIIIGLRAIFIAISNNYIKKNRDQLFNNSTPLSKQCKNLSIQLFEQESQYNSYINSMGLKQTYNCSSSVVSNAQNNTIKYLIKYSNLKNDIHCIEQLDFCINFLESLHIFRQGMKQLCTAIKSQLPIFVSIFASDDKIPFIVCDIDTEINRIKRPTFYFSYVSPAGRSSRTFKIKITSSLLKEIQAKLAAKINKTGHTKVQRNAMTNDLREAIKKRDNYTCCICGNSVFNEPNLLLEVDHIIPISKGGKTEACNLQTLCWRCNRAKSNSI